MLNPEFSLPRRLHNNKSGGSPLAGPCALALLIIPYACTAFLTLVQVWIQSACYLISTHTYTHTNRPLLWENLSLALGHASPCKHFLTFLEPMECVWVQAGYAVSKMFEELGVCFLSVQGCYHVWCLKWSYLTFTVMPFWWGKRNVERESNKFRWSSNFYVELISMISVY